VATSTAAEFNCINAFFKELAAAKESVLLLDYDGTIASFNTDRRRAFPYPEVAERLQSIIKNGRTKVIVVSGRSAWEIPGLLGICPTPEIWGTDGIERIYADGHYQEVHVRDDAIFVLTQAENRLEKEGLGDCIEVKLAGVAVHWRGLPSEEMRRVKATAAAIFEPLTAEKALVVAEFDTGLELRLASANKGESLRGMLRDLDPATAIAYLGDDATDEDAFQVLGNRGLSVLVHAKHRPDSAAHAWLKPPYDVVKFLDRWVRTCDHPM